MSNNLSKKPVILHVTWTLKPGTGEKFLEIFKPVAEKIAAEKECRYLNVFQDIRDENIFKIVQIWDADATWISTTLSARDYYPPFFEAMKEIAVKHRESNALLAVDGFNLVKPT
ncbi:hypothetical protein BT63DRAFT_247604 [Microthyrium microscopicum]|uniref:ABM domain-containing protein n=1 Tax=Microthyrium microscopicum TaxID=703497 RepID=A0A6A6UAL0_9PEZI|nr:hypothetical protein BT63DRAFT_247604 [Microthyrium microscopicum]